MICRRQIRICSRKNQGHTLVEVSVAAAISLIAVVAIVSMFIAASKMSVESYLRNKAAMEARSVIDHLTTDARSAVDLDSSVGSFTAGPTTLILKLPSITADGLPVDIDTTFDWIVYSQNAKDRLTRTVIADESSSRQDETKVLGRGAQPEMSIAGTYAVQPNALGAYVIHYQFTAVQLRGDKKYTKPVAGSVRLRNRV